MSKQDASAFFEKLEKDPAFRLQIGHAKNEKEALDIIHNRHHLQFDEKEYRSAFQEKYHRPLKKEELHKMVAEGLLAPDIAAKIPFTAQKPHHGE